MSHENANHPSSFIISSSYISSLHRFVLFSVLPSSKLYVRYVRKNKSLLKGENAWAE